MADTVGEADLRAENVSPVVTGFALQNYTFRNSLMVDNSSAWKETYFVETAADLTNASSPVKGIPRLANFPYGEVEWTETSKRHEKYGMEGVISYEDKITNDVDTIGRTLLRIGRAVANAVDSEIYTQVSTLAGNTETIAAGKEWDSGTLANRDPIQNILNAQKLIAVDNYKIYQGGELWLNPTDYANLLGNANVRNAGQFWTSSPTKTGAVAQIAGLTVKVSNTVTDDEAIVMIPKIAGTWKSAAAVRIVTEETPGIKTVIRAFEIGVAQIKNPDAICKIVNTTA